MKITISHNEKCQTSSENDNFKNIDIKITTCFNCKPETLKTLHEIIDLLTNEKPNLHIEEIKILANGYIKLILLVNGQKVAYYFYSIKHVDQVIRYAQVNTCEDTIRRAYLYANFVVNISTNTVLKNRSFDFEKLFDQEVEQLKTENL